MAENQLDTHAALKADIERVAAKLNVSPATIGGKVGQGGHFYKRLSEGRRIWPETAAEVRKRLHQLEFFQG